MGRWWLRLDSWLRGERWPDAWAVYYGQVIPLLIADAMRELPAQIYVPANWRAYEPAFQGPQVQLIREGGTWAS